MHEPHAGADSGEGEDQYGKIIINHLNCEKVSWVAAELGMSGDGNDEEIVKLSIEGKVMMALMITTVILMKMTSTMMMTMMLMMMMQMQMMMVMMAGARDPRGKGWKQDRVWFQEGEERKVGCIKVDNVYVHNIQHLSCSHKHMVVMVM